MERNILIFGSETETGIAVSQNLKHVGWNVVGIDYSESAKNSSTTRYYACSLDKIEETKSLLNNITSSIEKVDAIYIALDEINYDGFEKTGYGEWQKMLHYVFGSCVNICSVFIPEMIKSGGGRVVILSPDYRNSKEECILKATAESTIHGFAKSLCAEVSKDNILINVIAPCLPYDLHGIAETVRFFCEEANYIAGQVISIAEDKTQLL